MSFSNYNPKTWTRCHNCCCNNTLQQTYSPVLPTTMTLKFFSTIEDMSIVSWSFLFSYFNKLNITNINLNNSTRICIKRISFVITLYIDKTPSTTQYDLDCFTSRETNTRSDGWNRNKQMKEIMHTNSGSLLFTIILTLLMIIIKKIIGLSLCVIKKNI